MANASILDLTVRDIDGKDVRLANYRGQVLLVVNVASLCGNTPQYSSLESLYQEYRGRGLRILAFPANDFGAQEPGTEAEIKEFCSKKYAVTFDLFSKITVKGPTKHPLFAMLIGAPGTTGEIAWNFEKFLVDRTGLVAARFGAKIDPRSPEMIARIEELLKH